MAVTSAIAERSPYSIMQHVAPILVKGYRACDSYNTCSHLQMDVLESLFCRTLGALLWAISKARDLQPRWSWAWIIVMWGPCYLHHLLLSAIRQNFQFRTQTVTDAPWNCRSPSINRATRFVTCSVKFGWRLETYSACYAHKESRLGALILPEHDFRCAGVIWLLFLNRTPIFDWCVPLRWRSKNKHDKDTCSEEIALCLQILLTTPHSVVNITIGRA